jgi:hypothetical protein
MCLSDGAQCHDLPGECCNGNCNHTLADNECGPPGCLQVDTAPCTTDSQCCTGYCNTTSTPTWGPHCQSCGYQGDPCADSSKCCNFGGPNPSTCVNGHCT